MASVTPPMRARRLLALLHLLDSGSRIALETVADTLDLTPAEAATELEMLACCGTGQDPTQLVPVIVEDGFIEVWGSLPALDRPVRLSASEAGALVAALQAAGIAADNPLVTRLMNAAASDEVTAEELARLVSSHVAGGGTVLEALALALETHRAIEISYQSAGAEEPTERIVEPVGLVNERGAWYLEAYCRNAGALRTFRADRIRHARVLGEQCPERGLSPAGRAFAAEGLPVARIRLDPDEEFTAREWPGARMAEQRPDGTTIVEVPFAGTEWIARQVLARLGRAEVLEPAEARTAVARLVRAEMDRLAD